MQRRTFIKDTALCAVAISASGFIKFDGFRYVGDCETTTDILGPFYRPDSPLRTSLLIKGEKGVPIELSGKILHKNCITPYNNARVEIWHCDGNGVYDNTSDQYRYRATTYSDENGNYLFQTILPVPYDVGGGLFRPAHFHMMISAEGYQPLVTQLYFTGDAHIAKDASASSPAAKKRVLNVQDGKNGSKKVVYNVGMSDTLALETASLDRLTGLYVDSSDATKTMELFETKNELWIKNKIFGTRLNYLGNNTFELGGADKNDGFLFKFELPPSGPVKATGSNTKSEGKKIFIWYKEN